MKFVSIVYLNEDIVLEIHKAQLEDHGGLESALAQPRATFDDELYDTMIAIAKREMDKEDLSSLFRES